MRRFLASKVVVLFVSVAGLAGLLILAAALREVQFRPAGPLPFNFRPMMGPSAGYEGPQLPALTWAFLALIVLVIVATVVVLLDPRVRKRFLLSMLRLVLTVLAVAWLMEYSGLQLPGGVTELGAGEIAPAEGGNGVEPPPEFIPPQISPWVGYVTSFAVALGLVALAWWLAARSAKKRPLPVLADLAGIAREALADLESGRNWDDAIVAAYVRMNEVVNAERGLVRQPGTTPGEFVVRMEQVGLPGEAARVLTRLFEQVRYGGQTATRQERDLAAAALSAILRACGVQA